MSDTDVQEREPEIALKIDKAGVKGVKKKISTQTPEGAFFYDVILDAYVDLPKTQRGTHMSRDIEAFLEAIEEAKKEESSSLEEVLHDICQKLIQKHSYATRAELIAKTRHQYQERFTKITTSEEADVTISVSMSRNDKDKKSVKVKVPGMTVCPCAQEMYSDKEETELDKTPSHTQRAKLIIEAAAENKLVRLDWLIEAARKAFSAPTVSLLKREDEYSLIKQAYQKPRFIEDLIRHALQNCYEKLIEEGYPEDTVIKIEAESFESIHPHNAYASRETTLGELKEEKEFEDNKNHNSNQ
ncbi:hypothetical protein AKJ49_00445 [candidate division MSBL1 archaeon SCGC-AAA382A03]|uniref:GTP cyclohydrolase MptA n=1 Tax=candidate division MSBL1 archaeon SCGC-AAA382A03 TaxID=1698278 RepID=A0A133VGP3_9EURY|nr:hypothetical protein AKJ49_00445 [candidate division MSBL1 archaeon SCGC-AAA382A03]